MDLRTIETWRLVAAGVAFTLLICGMIAMSFYDFFAETPNRKAERIVSGLSFGLVLVLIFVLLHQPAPDFIFWVISIAFGIAWRMDRSGFGRLFLQDESGIQRCL